MSNQRAKVVSKPHCTGMRKDGERCAASPLKGTERCRRHPLNPADASDASRTHNEEWSRSGFLAAFSKAGMVSRACEVIGISRQTAYVERQRNEDFALEWADVEERTTETMEAEAYRRAVEGVTEPVVSAGKHVTDVQSYSDRLLEFMLKARRPEKYRDRVDVKHSGKVEQRVKLDLSKLDDAELANLEHIAAKMDG